MFSTYFYWKTPTQDLRMSHITWTCLSMPSLTISSAQSACLDNRSISFALYSYQSDKTCLVNSSPLKSQKRDLNFVTFTKKVEQNFNTCFKSFQWMRLNTPWLDVWVDGQDGTGWDRQTDKCPRTHRSAETEMSNKKNIQIRNIDTWCRSSVPGFIAIRQWNTSAPRTFLSDRLKG